jgi:hypothetical protein
MTKRAAALPPIALAVDTVRRLGLQVDDVLVSEVWDLPYRLTNIDETAAVIFVDRLVPNGGGTWRASVNIMLKYLPRDVRTKEDAPPADDGDRGNRVGEEALSVDDGDDKRRKTAPQADSGDDAVRTGNAPPADGGDKVWRWTMGHETGECRIAMLDPTTGRQLGPDHPVMRAATRVFWEATDEERSAWHRFCCENSRDVADIEVAEEMSLRIKEKAEAAMKEAES